MACIFSTFCVSTGNLYDDQYDFAGTHNGFDYYSGSTNSYVIYYSLTENRWCLSDILDNPCLQFGQIGIGSDCPDFDESFFVTGTCSTTTTTTSPCDIFSFDAIFDCLVPTTTTTTSTSTTTTTTTIPPFDPCTGVSVNASITAYTTTTTTVPVTTTTTTEVIRPCEFSGTAKFNIFDEFILCGNSKKFRDCLTGFEYYSNELLFNESGNTLVQGYVYKTTINGLSICATFVGLVDTISGVDTISIVETLGPENEGSCLQCIPDPPPPPYIITECINAISECFNVNVSAGPFLNGRPTYSWSNFRMYWDDVNIRWVAENATTGIAGAYLEADISAPVGSASEWVNAEQVVSCLGDDSGFQTQALVGICPTTTTTTIPPCQLIQYLITNNSLLASEFRYSDCNGNTINDLLPGNYGTKIVCSATTPIVSGSAQIENMGIIC